MLFLFVKNERGMGMEKIKWLLLNDDSEEIEN